MARAMKKVIDRTVVNPNIDTQWFVNTLRDLKISLRGYDRHPEVKGATGYATRLFRGMKQFSTEDGRMFSRVTGTDFNEVMKRAVGLAEADTDVADSRMVVVEGWVDLTRRVRSDGLLGPRRVTLPPDMGSGTIALRYQTQGTNLDAMDGAIIYCRPLGPFNPEMLNRWCYVKIAKGGVRLIRILKKGSSAGRFNLWNDTDVDADVEIVSAAAVEWMRF